MALTTNVNAPARTANPTFGGSSRRTNVRLWITQGALAAVFLFAGISKLVMPAADLTENTALTAGFLRFIGVCETLGAVGLVLPWLLNVRRGLTPLAASGLVVIMAGATVVTAIEMGVGPSVVPFVVGCIAASVAVGRRTH